MWVTGRLQRRRSWGAQAAQRNGGAMCWQCNALQSNQVGWMRCALTIAAAT
jgi:hypothetical protein